MNWNNLRNGKCPKCEGKLINVFPNLDMNHCATTKYVSCEFCDFKIGEQKLAKIIAPRSKSAEFMDADERLSELNNYGRKPMSEDFSDSPFL